MIMLTRRPRAGTILEYTPIEGITKYYKLKRKSCGGKIGHIVELDRKMKETIFHTSIILEFEDGVFNELLSEVKA